MHHVFIVNPTAGKGRAVQMIDRINSRFLELEQSYEIKITEAPGHARQIAREAAASNEEIRLYSVGGDGTLNEVVNGMAGSRAELGIIPCGSGNDSVRSLYNITDPIKLIEVLPASPSSMLDLGRLNDKFFLNISSIGFDADVTMKSHNFKRFPFVSGSMAYILGILSALIQLNKYKLRMTLNESTGETSHTEKEILMAIFANGSFYGGGMKPAPKAKMDDGVLDFCIVKPITRLKVLQFFPRFKKGEHESMRFVEVKRGTGAVFESDLPFPVNIDGEVSTETRAAIEILPASIRVIIPG